MKKVLIVIARFFQKIWKWIVETAWVQPLLIVGIIFGVIFSIPAISDWIKTASENRGQGDFYKSRRLSDKEIEGLIDGETTIIDKLEKNNRFLVVIVGVDCTNCHDAEAGFKRFYNGTGLYRSKDEQVALYTIYTVEDKNNNRYDTYEKFDDTQQELIRESFVDFMDSLGRTDSEIKAGLDNIQDSIPTPTLLLYEGDSIIAVSFGVKAEQETDSSRALYINDFYFGTGDFEPAK